MSKEKLSEQLERNKLLITKSEPTKKNTEPAPRPILPDKKQTKPGQIKLNEQNQ